VNPLYTVVNAMQRSATTIDDVTAADQPIKIVPDSSIPVDVLVGGTWLDLPHVNYFKEGGEIVFESINHIETDVLDLLHWDDKVYVVSLVV